MTINNFNNFLNIYYKLDNNLIHTFKIILIILFLTYLIKSTSDI